MLAMTPVRKRIAAVVLAALLTVGLSACFADVTSGEPPDPWAAELFRATNRDRANNGLPPLSYSPKLENNAQTWAKTMSDQDRMYHQDLNALIRTSDYANFCSLGENIAWNNAGWTAQDHARIWYNSAPHRANILNRNFNVVGMAKYTGPHGRTYAAVEFGYLCR